MDSIAYFDCACYLGRNLHTGSGQPSTPDALLSAMDHFGIHEALVIDAICASTGARAGNRRILEFAKDHPRLHPAWAGMMTHAKELPPPDALVAEMCDLGVGALYLFYKQFDIPLEDWAVDDLLAVLEENNVPLFLCPNNLLENGRIDVTDWPNVVRLCRKFPKLPVVVTENRIYRSQRPLYEALAACPNLKLDLSSIWLNKRVEFICREFGAEHLVWGSQLPARTPGSPLMQLNYSDISADELTMIAGGNMRRMLSWNPNIEFVAEQVTLPEPVDSLHKVVRERISLRDERFYDCHGHIGWSSPYHVINDTPETIVAEMDKFGIEVACAFSIQIVGDVAFGNDEVMEVVNQFPSRFIPFTLLNPYHGEAAMLEELERGLAMGMMGVKLMLNSYACYDVHGPLVDVACKFANDHKQFILSHHWGPPARIQQLCTDNPDALFISGHSAGDYGEVTRAVDNLYICTCPFLAWGQTEAWVDIYGADKILFGSDLTDLPISWGLGQIMYSTISEADKRKILGENLLGLMQRWDIFPAASPAGA